MKKKRKKKTEEETPAERSKSTVEFFKSHGIDSKDMTKEDEGTTSIWLRFGPLDAPDETDDRSETLMRNLHRRGGR